MKVAIYHWCSFDDINGLYVERELEYLTEILHPMAAVAWDRDSPEVLQGRELHGEHPLRFFVMSNGADVYTGEIGSRGSLVATWNNLDGGRWVRVGT